MNKIDKLKSQVNKVPSTPGCYLWKNKSGEVIYVGKAKRLKSRMKQYLDLQDSRDKIPLLVNDIESFEYVVVSNEEESLILEKNLIHKYKPYYNADFKDDKSYPFIAITKGDVFPAIKYTREKHVNTTMYFGPYTDSKAARNMVDLVRKIVPICSCACATWRKLRRNNFGFLDKNSKALLSLDKESDDICEALSNLKKQAPCFDCHVGLGPGVCCGKICPSEYSKNISMLEKFLNGYQRDIINRLQNDMKKAAIRLDFEKAGRIKQRLETIETLNSKQIIVSQSSLDADIIAFYREETIAAAYVFNIREGRIVKYNEYILNRGLDITNQEIMHNFLIRYYESSTSVGRLIIVNEIPIDAKEMSIWLTKKLNNSYGAKVRFFSPKIGEKKELLEMATRNAKHTLLRYKVKSNYDDNRINKALLQLESALALSKSPMRIECYDISTIHGSYTVASMVVFVAGKPDKSQYRHFKIKTKLEEANDYLCMQEVLKRRLMRSISSSGMSDIPDKSANISYDTSFAKLPDLLLLDGGRPQLSAAIKVFDLLGLDPVSSGVDIVGLAKRDEELYTTWNGAVPVVLPDGSESLYLVKQIRDEAHRFAISFHRRLRDKGMTASVLDDVAGVGNVRKKALLKHFKSFKNLRDASLSDIKKSKIVPNDVAEEIYLVLRQLESM